MLIGIIVSYQPNPKEIILQVKTVIDEVDYVILVENGSDKNIQIEIEKKLVDPKIFILQLPQNEGLGKAQNVGIQKGLSLGANYFLFLDDDSNIKKGSIELLRKEFEINPKLGIAACHILHEGSTKVQKYWVKKKFFYKRLEFKNGMKKFENLNTVISSGSLISKEIIEKCGLFREDFFIDYIDIEYCLRIRANGFSITVLKDAELFHKLGNTKSVQIGNLTFHPSNHSPERRYYMIRNRIWTWKLYAIRFPGWFLIDFGNFIADNVRVFLFEKGKLKKGKFFWKGLRDGIFKK